MKLYRWVQAINRFAHNVHNTVPAVLKIADAVEILMVRTVILVGFFYGLLVFIHRH